MIYSTLETNWIWLISKRSDANKSQQDIPPIGLPTRQVTAYWWRKIDTKVRFFTIFSFTWLERRCETLGQSLKVMRSECSVESLIFWVMWMPLMASTGGWKEHKEGRELLTARDWRLQLEANFLFTFGVVCEFCSEKKHIVRSFIFNEA